jgi:hypothetical protein
VVAGDLAEPQQYFVFDTSSLIAIREIVPAANRRGVLGRLMQIVKAGELVFPSEVLDELERHAREHDPILDWVVAAKPLACRFGSQFDALRIVMSDPQAKRVIDVDKTAGVDEADPHVLALAIHLRQHANVVVVTEETRDRGDRTSMTTACGVLRLFRLPMKAFLTERKIWPN